MHRTLYREAPPESNNALIFTIKGGELTETEKKDGKWFRARVIDAAECGSRIASRRITNGDFTSFPGEILPELYAVVEGHARVYWGCLMAQQIHKWVAPSHVIVDYRALREREAQGLPVELL